METDDDGLSIEQLVRQAYQMIEDGNAQDLRDVAEKVEENTARKEDLRATQQAIDPILSDFDTHDESRVFVDTAAAHPLLKASEDRFIFSWR